MTKRLLLIGMAFMMSSAALADCHMKCVARNPFNGDCLSKAELCDAPKSLNDVIATLDQTLKGVLDPGDGLQKIADKLGVDRTVSALTLDCMMEAAATGAFGTICAAGIVASEGGCFAEPTCVAACLAAGDRFQKALEECE